MDPLRDTETIFQELRLKDIEYLTNNIDKVGKVVARMGDKDKAAKNEYETMLKVRTEDRRESIREGYLRDFCRKISGFAHISARE